MHLCYPFLILVLFRQCPAPQDSSPRFPLRKSLLTHQRQQCLGSLLGCLPLPAELMEPGVATYGKRQTEGVRQFVGEGERLIAPLQGLVRIAQ